MKKTLIVTGAIALLAASATAMVLTRPQVKDKPDWLYLNNKPMWNHTIQQEA